MAIMNKASVVSLAVLAALSTQAFANNKQETEDKVIEEVVALGKKISYANNVIETSMLEQQTPITSVMAVMDNLPGISINEGDAFGGDDWSTAISMRGFSIDSNQQQLGMTVDGIPNGGSNYGGGAKANRYLDAENMATVEVAQGTSDIASASLEALGGTFNFVSIDPSDEEETTFALSLGQYNAQRFYVRHQTGEIFGNTRAYVSLSETSNKRWVGNGDNGGAERQHFEAKFVTELDQLTLTGRLSYDDANEDNYNWVSINQFKATPDWDQLTWSWTGIPHLDQMYAEGWSTLRTNTLAYLKAEYAFSPTSLLTVTPYWHKNEGRGDWIPPGIANPEDADGNPTNLGGSNSGSHYFEDTAGNPLAPNANCDAGFSWPWGAGGALHPACYDRSAVPVMSFRNTNYNKDRKGFLASYETTVGINDIKAGLWYENAKRDENRTWHRLVDARIGMMAEESPYWMQYKNTFTTETTKWYVQDTINLEELTVNLGAQQFLIDVDKFDHFAGQQTAQFNSDSDVLLSAGVVYALDENVELFGGYSENFSSVKDAVLENDANNYEEIDPETAENIDFGMRFNGDRLSVTATGYFISFDNRIRYIAQGDDGVGVGINYDNGDNGTYVNEGGVESKGIELSATYQLTDNWNLYGSLTKNDSTYQGSGSDYREGDTVKGAAEEMFVITADYTKNNLRYGVSAKYTGDRTFIDRSANDTEHTAEAYTLVDMYVGYNLQSSGELFKSMDIAFVLNNAFDESYLSAGRGNGTQYFIGAPKTAAVTFTASF